MSPAEQWANVYGRDIPEERKALEYFTIMCKQLYSAQKLLENVAGVYEDPASAYEALDIEQLLEKIGHKGRV